MKPLADTLQIKIEDDGTITVVTGKIGAEAHHSAEEFLNECHKLLGGDRIEKHLDQQHQTTHHHRHVHHHQKVSG